MANKFRLLLEFCWANSGGKNIVQNLLLRGALWLNYRCSWVVGAKLWLVVVGRRWLLKKIVIIHTKNVHENLIANKTYLIQKLKRMNVI